MAMVTDPASAQQVLSVTGGVDTHADVHVAAVIDAVGRELGHDSFATTPAGYVALLAWLEDFGPLEMIGVEGTGMYGTGLTPAFSMAHANATRSLSMRTSSTTSPCASTAARPPSPGRCLKPAPADAAFRLDTTGAGASIGAVSATDNPTTYGRVASRLIAADLHPTVEGHDHDRSRPSTAGNRDLPSRSLDTYKL
jgi:hypothetical protein